MKNIFLAVSVAVSLTVTLSSCKPRKDVNDVSVSQAPSNPWLASDKMATTHFDMAQSDNFNSPVKIGEFNIDPLDKSTKRITSGPVNIITLKAVEEGFWWGLATDKITYIDGRGGKWEKVAVYDLPNVPQISDENLAKVVGREYFNANALASDYDKYWATSKATNPTMRMLTGNSIYAVVDREGYIYLTASGMIYKLEEENNTIRLINKIDVKSQMAVPKELEEYIDLSKIPGGITGVQMTYDGTLVVGTIFGLVAVDRNLETIKDNISLPITSFFSEFPPKKGTTPEFISNSFAIDENNGIYVASGVNMNKIVWTGKKLSTDKNDGAWSAPYITGDHTPTIKYGTGTGSTPTLMGFGKDEDHLVVITDGANRMNLTAFWRDRQLEGNQIADRIEVNCGFGETPPAFIQSEQSVATLGYGAFVVNNIAPNEEGLRDFDPTNKVNDLIYNVLAVGPIVKAGQGVERFEWNTKKNKWKRVWANPDVSSTSMVPSVSATSNIVLMNTYDSEHGWQVLGMDWETGEIVHTVNFGRTSYGNGAYALIQYDENGDLIFNSIGGTMRIPLVE